MHPVFFYLIILKIIKSQYANSPCFTTQLVTLWDHNDPSHPYVPSGYSFTRAWSSTLPNLTSVTLSLNSFKIAPANVQTSFQTTISFTTSQGIINILVSSGFQITFIQYSVLLVSSCSGKIDNIIKTHNCNYLNISGRTGQYQYFYVASTKFPTFTVPGDYIIGIFLQSFIGSTSNVQDIGFGHSATYATNIQFFIYSLNTSYHIITNATFTIFIIQFSSFNDSLVKFQNKIQMVTPIANPLTFSFSAPAIFSPGTHSSRCFYGLTWILNQLPSANPTEFYSFTPAGVQSTIWNTNIGGIDYQIFCFAKCQNSTYIVNPTVSTVTCVLCSTVISGCYLCVNSTFCDTCRTFFNNQTNGTCLINCTTIQYCATCSAPIAALNCLTCQFGYSSNSTNCNSICGDGYITPEEECDDNNSLSNDGCSNICAFELRFYCYINLTINICYPCSSYCITCSNSSLCIQCQATAYLLNRTSSLVCYNNTCPVNYFGFSVSSTIKNCIPCPYDCLICTNQTACTTCQLGLVVKNGCSRIVGCIEVIQDPILMKSPCIACEPTLNINLTAGTCSCPFGYQMITRYCTNITGCLTTSLSLNDSFVSCINCDKPKGLTLINGKCYCKPGMSYNNLIKKCQEICGDGILYQMECDDGNLVNGDGCSSICQIENKYSCINGSAVHPSICVYIGQDFKITFESVDKIDNENKAIITLNFRPQLQNFNSLSIISTILFTCNKTSQLAGWSYSDGQLLLEVNYHQQIQGTPASVNINFNNAFIPQSAININFTMTSKGMKLFFVTSYENAKTIQTLFFVLNCIVFFAFIIGSISHKMIGVQTISCFQLIFFIHSINNNYTFIFSMFKCLTYLNGNVLYFFNKQMNIPNPSNSFLFSSRNQYVSILCIFALSSIALVLTCACKYLTLKANNQITRLSFDKLCIKAYNHIIFPIVVGFYLVNGLIYNIMTRSSNFLISQNLNQHLCSLINYFLLGFTAFVICYEGKGIIVNITNIQNKQSYYGLVNCHQSHIPIYLTYMILINLSLALNYSGFSNYTQKIIVGLTLLFFLRSCCRKIYDKKIHNIGLIFNLLLVLLFGTWSILRNYLSILLKPDVESIVFFGIIGLMFISVFISLLRAIIEIKQSLSGVQIDNKKIKYQNKKILKQKLKKVNQKLKVNNLSKILQNLNPYCSVVIQQKQKIEDWTEQNKKRLLNNHDMIYTKQQVEQQKKGFNVIFRHRIERMTDQNINIKKLKQQLKQSFKKKSIGIEKNIYRGQDEI